MWLDKAMNRRLSAIRFQKIHSELSTDGDC
jgi:hypothetical protein